jgi:SAM-dependent methyltransferase
VDLARRIYFNDLIEWLERSIKIDRAWTLLEFGVGKRGFPSEYRKRASRVYAVDIFDYSQYYDDVEFIISDGNTIPLQAETVDLVVSHSTLEHLGDIAQSLKEMDRVVKIGGYIFLTVSPLYYAARGSHVATLSNWEHLNRSNKKYLTQHPIDGKRGAYLNKLTSKQFLSSVGVVPWDILRYELRHEHALAPKFALDEADLLDVYIKEFRFIGHKKIRLSKEGGAVSTAAYKYYI